MKKVILKNRPRGFRSTGVVIDNGRLLLMKQVLKGEVFYTLPGGHWEDGETLEETCKREIKEEFNVEAVVDRLIYYLDTESRLNFVFSCNYISGELELGGPEKEHMNENEQYFPMWVDISQLKDLNITPVESKNALLKYFENKEIPAFFDTNIKSLSKKVLIIAPDSICVPPKLYGGRERMAALAYEYYKDLGYEVDIASKVGSDYHTFSLEDLADVDLGNYRLIITYTYGKDLIQRLDKCGRRVFVILENNYSEKLAYLKDLKRCECFVLSGDQQTQYFNNLGIGYEIKPNCIDFSLYSLNKTNRDKDIVYIGAIGQHKSPLACLEYAKKYNLGIDFYGPIIFSENEKEYGDTFLTAVKNYPKARLMGEIGDQEKVKVLNDYKYFIFLAGLEKPEWTEPFGLAPLEALACGCTVITQFERGGHLSYCNKNNSINYTELPKQFNEEQNRNSVLQFDKKRIFSTYYPR